MHILTQRLSSQTKQLFNAESLLTLALVAEDRIRSRHRFTTVEGEAINLQLPRGTVLREGDFLANEHGQAIAKVVAQTEPVLTVTAHHALDFLRTAII